MTFAALLKIDCEHRTRMFLFNKEAILGDEGGGGCSPVTAALKERAKLRYFSRLGASDKEIEPSVPTLLGKPQPLDSKKKGTAGK